MSLIKRIAINPHQAKELIHLGFVLKLVSFGMNIDTYDVYVINGGK